MEMLLLALIIRSAEAMTPEQYLAASARHHDRATREFVVAALRRREAGCGRGGFCARHAHGETAFSEPGPRSLSTIASNSAK